VKTSILSHTFKEEIWRIRTNQDMREVYKIPHMIKDIRMRRVKWLGFVISKE
jgi:hypothetical protein